MSTKHFSEHELQCRCGCKRQPPEVFQAKLEKLRVSYRHPMRVSSGFRCPEYNATVSVTGVDGPHTIGAVDILTWGAGAHDLVTAALKLGWTGIGISQKGHRESRFIHLDDLDGPLRPWIWSY